MSNFPIKRSAGQFVWLPVLVLPLLMLAAGCHRDDVKVYRIAKDQDQSSQPTAPALPPDSPNPKLPPGHPDISAIPGTPAAASAALPQLTWKTPAGWTEVPPSEMRVASFTITGTNGETANVGIIPLPATGQEIQLVNMWREQMQLPALTNETTTEAVSVGSDSAKLFDIASDALLIDGKFRARILVAMLARGTTSWFFKMTGEDSFVASQKQNFLQFLKSVSFAENPPAPTTASPMPGTSLGNQNFLVPNADTLVIGGTNSSGGGNSIWTIPPGWRQLPPSEFLLAEFSISGTDGGTAGVNVARLAGEGGGLLANVNRWRGQLGLEPLKNEMELAHIVPEMDLPNGGHLTIVDFTGTDSKTGKPARLIGVIVPQNGQTWFYKLMGDEPVVARQKDAFIKFIQSAKYPDAGNAP